MTDSPLGLSSREAAARLADYGPNEIAPAHIVQGSSVT